jgi:6-pyruvoyltetrahydropterin/6-carboxytetrahydropterin synthase
MPSLFTLKVIADFAAAHTLRDYPGACSRMHGHNWKVEAEVEATQLDSIGMAIDFKDIKKATREIAARLDHRYLNDLEPFTERNPTAEHIAEYFFDELSARLNSEHIRVAAITLWETERACVRYSRDQE